MEKENERELVVLPGTGITETTDDIIASAERRLAKVEKIIELSLKRTNQNDWVDQQGKPYLTSSGAEKIARLFGVCWKILKSEKIISEDEKGHFYFYQVTGVFSLGKGVDSIEAVGTCSSKDQFFAKVHGELRPLSEVEETNIMKAAYSNCVVNGITRLLGIRNLTWEQVKAGGIDQSKVAKVDYATGGAGGGKISEAQAKRFFAIAKTSGKKEEEIREFLRKCYPYTIDKENNEVHSKNLERKDYDNACELIAKKSMQVMEEINAMAKEKELKLKGILKEYYEKDNIADLTDQELFSLYVVVKNK